jgi:ATPase subunit of ABC transporter with duplicated ATPase domains
VDPQGRGSAPHPQRGARAAAGDDARGARLARVQGNVKLEVSQGERSGKIVAELTNVSKAYGDKAVVRDFTATIMRGDKVGLIGPNGVGKTTLLRLILGELPPDSGTVRNGSNLQVAYFDQMRTRWIWRSRSPTPSARAATGSRSTASAST